MTDVRIRDKFGIEFRGKMAAEWPEVTPAQFLKLAPVLMAAGVNAAEQRLLCFLILLNMKWHSFKLQWLLWQFNIRPEDPEENANDLLEDCAKQADFLFTDILLQKWLYPEITCRGKKYTSPENGFSGMSMMQFCAADTYYTGWAKTRRTDLLDKLVATLYMPNGLLETLKVRKRKEYSKHLVQRNALELSKLNEAQKLAILANFIGYRNYFISFFPEVFKKAAENTGGEDATWADLMADMADKDPTRLREVENMECFGAFLWLQRTIIRARKNPAKTGTDA